MRKYISISLAAVLIVAALVLTACGSGSSNQDLADSKYVGTWKPLDMSLFDESEAIEGDWVLILNPDGTGSLTGDAEEEEPSEFTWQPVDGGFNTKGDVKLKFKDDGDNIKTKILGATLTFEKQ